MKIKKLEEYKISLTIVKGANLDLFQIFSFSPARPGRLQAEDLHKTRSASRPEQILTENSACSLVQMYFLKHKMYLSRKENVFVQFVKCISCRCIVIRQGRQVSRSIFSPKIVPAPRPKSIYPKRKMYFSQQ